MQTESRAVPLRRRLFWLAAAAILPVALMSAIALQALFAHQRAQGEQAALEVARALGSAVDGELRRTRIVLEVLATSATLQTGDLKGFEERLRRVAVSEPSWRAAILTTPEGRVLIHTQQPLDSAIVVESDSLREAVGSRRPVFGYLARGPLGLWAVPVRVPVVNHGRVAYVLSAPIKPESLVDLVNRSGLPEGWVVTAVDKRGQRVFRWPRQEEYVGTPVSGTLRKMMDETPSGEGTGITTSSEGTEVYSAFTRLRESGWSIAVGIPTASVMAGARRSLATYGGGLLASILLGGFLALFMARGISRPMAALRETARALGRGERAHGVRSGVREIDQVSEAIVAASLEREQGEREREDLLRREQVARAEAESANRAKDEFLAMLGHELRNPLGAASNAAQLLRAGYVDEATRQNAAAIIVRQMGHLARLTDDLLEVARVLMGKIELRREPIDLAECTRRCLEALRAAGKTARHEVTAELSETWSEADASRYEQILTNLVVNATKYTPAGGRIRVSVREEGGQAVLRVADNGVGLSPELAARAFDLFVQGERELDRAQGGLGIGLTLVRRLAELHGGSADVRSDGPGEGSEFIVRLPTTAPPAGQPQAHANGALPPLRLLVIEDNEDARETLRMLLTFSGHEVHGAADGEQGLEAALERRPDGLFVDIGLPKLDGYGVARRLRAQPGYRPFLVALTGYGLPEDRKRAIEAGFDAHLVKPATTEAIEAVLAACAATRAA